MRFSFRIDLPCVSVAFVALLVLGVVLVMSPSPVAAAALQEADWLLPATACLLLGARPGARTAR
ncbi:hypothetical protein ABT174_20300 [Streptomyces sparsogenes]|uniref:hypothetical protein n=1 Tax=Streptomyces sparsogenes TaxID=67365 RepID=UPI00331DC214